MASQKWWNIFPRRHLKHFHGDGMGSRNELTGRPFEFETPAVDSDDSSNNAVAKNLLDSTTKAHEGILPVKKQARFQFMSIWQLKHVVVIPSRQTFMLMTVSNKRHDSLKCPSHTSCIPTRPQAIRLNITNMSPAKRCHGTTRTDTFSVYGPMIIPNSTFRYTTKMHWTDGWIGLITNHARTTMESTIQSSTLVEGKEISYHLHLLLAQQLNHIWTPRIIQVQWPLRTNFLIALLRPDLPCISTSTSISRTSRHPSSLITPATSWKHTTFTVVFLTRSTVIRSPLLGVSDNDSSGDDDDPCSTGQPYSICILVTPVTPVYRPFLLMNCIFSFPSIILSYPYPHSTHSDSCILA